MDQDFKEYIVWLVVQGRGDEARRLVDENKKCQCYTLKKPPERGSHYDQ